MNSDPTETPTYNLKAVVQETGLKPDTLRAWERRYGLPQPRRTRGRHRLYSAQDIAIVKWLISRQHEGLTISRAVDLWRQLESEGQDPFKVMPAETPLPVKPERVLAGETLAELRQAWVNACLNFDEMAAESVLIQAFALFSPEIVVLNILRRGLIEMEEGWQGGDISIQQAYFASLLAMRRLETLVTAVPSPTRPGRILVTCAQDDTHAFEPLSLTWLLRRQGWAAIYLGADVPVQQFEVPIQQVQPRLVILTAQRLHAAAMLQEMAGIADSLSTAVAFSGLIFKSNPSLRDHIPGRYLGDTLEDGPQVVEQLLNGTGTRPETAPWPEPYRTALSAFEMRELHITAAVWDKLAHALNESSRRRLAAINTQMSQGIAAALKFGDMNLLGADMAWLEDLHNGHKMPVAFLQAYMNAYCQTAHEHLDPQQAAPVLAWLNSTAAHCNHL